MRETAVTFQRRLPATLTKRDRDSIARFVTRFIAYPRAKLEAVLDASAYVWIGRDGAGEIVATTAVRLLQVRDAGRAAIVIYTAMVAVDPAHRRCGLIQQMGLRSFLLARARTPFRPIYWLSLSASPAAYMQMARNFATFWPRRDQPMPAFARAVLDQALGSLGITAIEQVEGCYRLPDEFGVSDRAQDPSRWDRSDADVDFFLRVNPGYQRGSDLACLCPLGLGRLVAGAIRQALRPASALLAKVEAAS